MYFIDNQSIIETDIDYCNESKIYIKNIGRSIPSKVIVNDIILKNGNCLPENTKLYIDSFLSNNTLLVIEKKPEVRTLLFNKSNFDYLLQLNALKYNGIINNEEFSELQKEFDIMGETLRFRVSLPYIEFIFMINKNSNLVYPKVAFRNQELTSIMDVIYYPPLTNINIDLSFCHHANINRDDDINTMINSIIDAFYLNVFNRDYSSNVDTYIEHGNFIGYIVYWHYITKKNDLAILLEKLNVAGNIYNIFMCDYKYEKMNNSKLLNLIENNYSITSDSFAIGNTVFMIGDEINIDGVFFYIDYINYNRKNHVESIICVNIKTNEKKTFSIEEFNVNKILRQVDNQVNEIIHKDEIIKIGDFVFANNDNISQLGFVTSIVTGKYNKLYLSNKYVFLTSEIDIRIFKTNDDLLNYFNLKEGIEYFVITKANKQHILIFDTIKDFNLQFHTESDLNSKIISADTIKNIYDLSQSYNENIRFGKIIYNLDYCIILNKSFQIINRIFKIDNFNYSMTSNDKYIAINKSLSRFLSNEEKTIKWNNFDGTFTEFNVNDKIVIEFYGIINIYTIKSFNINKQYMMVSFFETDQTFNIMKISKPEIIEIEPYKMLHFYEEMNDIKTGDIAQVKHSDVYRFYKKDYYKIIGFTRFKNVSLAIMSNGRTLFLDCLLQDFFIYKQNNIPVDKKELKNWTKAFEAIINVCDKNVNLKINPYEITSKSLDIAYLDDYNYVLSRPKYLYDIYMNEKRYSNNNHNRYTIPFPSIKNITDENDVQQKYYLSLNKEFKDISNL